MENLRNLRAEGKSIRTVAGELEISPTTAVKLLRGDRENAVSADNNRDR